MIRSMCGGARARSLAHGKSVLIIHRPSSVSIHDCVYKSMSGLDRPILIDPIENETDLFTDWIDSSKAWGKSIVFIVTRMVHYGS